MKNLLILVVTIILLCIIQSSFSELQWLEHPVKKRDSVRFLVVGDWGRRGQFNQSQVALQMGLVGKKLNVDFVISTGDNFYDEGLTGVDDPAFTESFTSIYTAPSLQNRWYTVLGNHDYMGNVEAQFSSALNLRDHRWICKRSFKLTAGIVEFFFIDTTPFVDKYFTDPGKHTFDWTNVLPRENYLSTLLQDLDLGLKNSVARWKIVVGHHAIKSAGHHGNTQELVDRVLPILEAKRVDMYINGHDHYLQHIVSNNNSKIQFLTSGGGSKAWKGDIKPWDPKEQKLMYDGQGFVSFQITKSKAVFLFHDVLGNVIHSYIVGKNSGSGRGYA